MANADETFARFEPGLRGTVWLLDTTRSRLDTQRRSATFAQFLTGCPNWQVFPSLWNALGPKHDSCIGRGCSDWVHRRHSRDLQPKAGQSPRSRHPQHDVPRRNRLPTVNDGSSDPEQNQTMTQHLAIPTVFAPPTREQWLALVDKDLKGAPFEKRLIAQLIEGLSIQPLYTADQAPSPETIGLPGQAPFARGSSQLRSPSSGWLILPEHRHPLPSDANLAILSDIQHGAHGVVVRLSPRLLGETGPRGGCGCGGGVLVDSVDDLEQLFLDVDLSKINLCLAAGPAFFAAAAQAIALFERRQLKSELMRVQFGADPLGTLAARGTLPRPAEAMLNEMAALAQRTSAAFPCSRAVTVSTTPYDNAGATAVQELAAAVATGVAYLRAMESASLTVAQACRQLQFSIAVGVDQFLEIAKVRALRMLWNRVLEAAQVPEDQRSMLIHARTSRRVLTQRDPWVNALRTTIGCFAAAIAGADQITVLPYDDVIGPSDAVAQRLARNAQIILQEEGQLGRVLDAAGGSYYVEHLTQALAEAGWKQFQELERRGGMLSVLRDGSLAKEIAEVWQKRAKDLGRRKSPITGVSEYANLFEMPSERAKIDTHLHESALLERRAKLATDPDLGTALSAVATASGPGRLDALVAATKAGATLFALQDALGRGGETVAPLHLRRFAAAYEQLRDQSDQLALERGQRPRVFSANMGPIAVHTARAAFAQNFFEAGGIEVLTNVGFADIDAAAEAFATSGAKAVIICSSDAWYDSGACELGQALKATGARRVILAGNPGQNEARYRAAGIDQFIYIGCDVLGTLTELAQNEKVES
jgi:methylmalonyl-CoA mutase